jgi:hypothetical protein
MRNGTSCTVLLGTAVALTLGFGVSMAECALIAPSLRGQTFTEAPIPVVDIKAGVNAGGRVGAEVDASVGAGGNGVDIDAGMDADSANVGADADVDAEAGAGGANVGADADVDAETGAGGANVTVPAGAQASSSILLLIIPLGGHQGEDAVSCGDRLMNGSCSADSGAELKAIPQSSVHFEIADASDGAARLPALTAMQPAPGEQPAASRSFGISLVDAVRTTNGIVVHFIIVNISGQTQAIPPVEVSLRNSAGQAIEHSMLSAPVDTLAGGERKLFRILVHPLPPNSARLRVALISPTGPPQH